VVISQLNKMLGSQFTMLRNVKLEGFESLIPLVLIGPPGITVINVSAEKGVFRAKEDAWLEMKGRTQDYEPARPNLIAQTQAMRRALENYFTQLGYEVPEISEILFFSDPGIHIDSVRPSVRILMRDSLDRFSSNLLQIPQSLSGQDVITVVELFNQPAATGEQPPFDMSEFKEPIEEAEPSKPDAFEQSALVKNINAAVKKLNLRRSQWILLVAMVVMEIIILMAFIFYIVVSA